MENMNQCIIYGNFTDKYNDSLLKITQLHTSKDIKFELMFVYLDENKLFLIDKFKSLPKDLSYESIKSEYSLND